MDNFAKTRIVLGSFLAFEATTAFCGAFTRGINVAALLFAVINIFGAFTFIFIWGILDAKLNSIKLHWYPALFFSVIFPIGLPLYFYYYFGFSKGSVKLLKTIGFLLVIIIVRILSAQMASALFK
jgi:hypothetical protein